MTEIPKGAVARIEITVMEEGHMSVNIFPNSPEHIASVLVAALDMYGYEVNARRRQDGMPSSNITNLEERANIPLVHWAEPDIAMG